MPPDPLPLPTPSKSLCFDRPLEISVDDSQGIRWGLTETVSCQNIQGKKALVPGVYSSTDAECQLRWSNLDITDITESFLARVPSEAPVLNPESKPVLISQIKPSFRLLGQIL